MKIKYEKAQRLLDGIYSHALVRNTTLFPVWIGESDCFWYERFTDAGREYRLVDANSLTNTLAFDHAALAGALSSASEKDVNGQDLPIHDVALAFSSTAPASLTTVSFTAFQKRWDYHVEENLCCETDDTPPDGVPSPDGKYVAFVRDYNLWISRSEDSDERALTDDGERLFAYAATGDGWGEPVDSGLQLCWSPDSKRIFTVQRDMRRVNTIPIVRHVPANGEIRPTVDDFPMALPGDADVPEYRLLSIEVETGVIQDAEYGRVPVSRNGWGFFNAGLGWWNSDSQIAYFVEQTRGDKIIRVVSFNTHSGECKAIFEERSDTHISVSPDSEEYPPSFVINETNELVWWSERSGHAHLYLYDLASGTLKNQITDGDWQVQNVVHFDGVARELFVQIAGFCVDRDPYYKQLIRVNIDTGAITEITSSEHDYVAISQKIKIAGNARAGGRDVASSRAISRSGRFAVVTRSRVDEEPVSLLFDADGRELSEVERGDLFGLPSDWSWPEPVKLAAADGVTDIYGVVFRPSDFTPKKSYPVISHVFNTPDFQWTPKGSFTNGANSGFTYLSGAALAELGFIVVMIDGRGTPNRSKAFMDHCYGWVESTGDIADHVAGIEQLCERYSYMDRDRVGMFSSAGGPGGVQALLNYPEFFKVGVSFTPHDSRLMPASMWGEKYEGLSGPDKERKFPEELAKNLRGKLLIAFGMLDNCNPPAGVFRIIEALHKENKDFDMIALPNLGHAPSSYLFRRGCDFFVRHLLNEEPPKEAFLKLPIG